jgi:hypothetical protein
MNKNLQEQMKLPPSRPRGRRGAAVTAVSPWRSGPQSFPNRGLISGPRAGVTFGADPTTIANNTAAVAAFYAAQAAAGTAPTAAQIQAAQAAVASTEADLVTANGGAADPGTIAAAKGYTLLQAGLGAGVAILAGFAIAKMLR